MLYRRLEFETGIILPSIQPVTANFTEGRKTAYPKGSKFIVMHRYRFAALDFLCGVQLYLQDRERQPAGSVEESNITIVRALFNLLEQILSARSPPLLPSSHSVQWPLLTSVAWFYERDSIGARLNTRGTFADEMFIFTSDREEFEVVLAEGDSLQSLRTQGRVVFSEV
jgi:hypothetical protein